MIKSGDKIKIAGNVYEIETVWNQGKHRVFKTKDKKEYFDLHKMEFEFVKDKQVQPIKGIILRGGDRNE